MSNAAAGWYDDGAGRQRWWDGGQWTEHYGPAAQHPAQAVAVHTGSPLDMRRANLSQAVATYVRGGWRVEAQTDSYAVLVYGNRTNHILHLILTLVTAGLWAIVWLIVGLSGGEKRRTLRVDDYGNVLTT